MGGLLCLASFVCQVLQRKNIVYILYHASLCGSKCLLLDINNYSLCIIVRYKVDLLPLYLMWLDPHNNIIK